MCTNILVYTGTVVHTGPVVYTGAVVYAVAVVHTIAMVYTGIVGTNTGPQPGPEKSVITNNSHIELDRFVPHDYSELGPIGTLEVYAGFVVYTGTVVYRRCGPPPTTCP